MFDLIIRGGAVYDGTGRPARWADVAVSGGKIAAVEPLPQARAARVIDARGKWVTPGFIDIHRHADAAAFRPGFGELELRQGLTTIVNGNCGLSCAPVGPENLPAILSYLEPICGRCRRRRHRRLWRGILPPSLPLPCTRGCWWEPVPSGPARPGTRSSGWSRRIMPPSTGGWSRPCPTVPWGYPWVWAYAPECFYTTHELIRALAPWRGRASPSPSTCARRAAAW